MVPMFTWGLFRSNFSFAICSSAPQIKVVFAATANPEFLIQLPASALALVLVDNFLSNRIRRFGVVRKVHGEIGTALGAAAQIRRISKHLRERHFRTDHVAAGTILSTLNRRAASVQIAVNGGYIFFRDDYFHCHDRFQQNRRSFVASFLES